MAAAYASKPAPVRRRASTASAARIPLLIAGPIPSPLRSRASPRGVADEAEPVAGELARRAAAHDVGVAAKRLDGEIGRQPTRGPQRAHERVAPPRQIRTGARDAADADIEDVTLGEVPAVAFEIRLDVELGGFPPLAERLDALGREPRLALLRDHDLFLLGHLPERLSDRAAMTPGADDERRAERAVRAHDPDPVGVLRHLGHPGSFAHVDAGGAGAVEQIVVELPAEDAVAGRPLPPRLGARAVELEPACRERLDGQRIFLRIDLGVGERFGGDPPGADLHPWKDRGVQEQRAKAGPCEPPCRGAAARTATDHDHVVLGHVSHARE
jgi:hypothetical protein